jgi:hypothetical protein
LHLPRIIPEVSLFQLVHFLVEEAINCSRLIGLVFTNY